MSLSKCLNKISVKYGAAFISVAVAMLTVVIVDLMLVNSLKTRMAEFGSAFNNATSAVLNADRDLYQAHVATLEILRADRASPVVSEQLAAYRENAQQAYDRMHLFAQQLAAYPDILAKLDGFESRYETWRAESGRVFELFDTGRAAAAIHLFEGKTQDAFDKLREIYDVAGQAANAKIQALEASATARADTQEYFVIGFSLLVCGATLVVALAGPLVMSRAIQQITQRIHEITEGDGDLTARIETKRRDELGELALHFNAFIQRIDETFQTVRESTGGVHSASGEIAQGSQNLAARTEQSASNLQETSASLEEITATVANTSDAAGQADKLAQSTQDVARQGAATMGDLENTMGDISESARQISEITTLIDGIAFQTNLLALNASVEAARAGEHGRGFAVVAQEVRTLANRAGEASSQIRALIDSSVMHTQSGVKLVKATGTTMQEIVSSVERVGEVIGEISSGAREQSQGIAQINTAINDLDSMTQHNSAMVEQTSAAALHMRGQAEQLKALLATFRLSSDRTKNAGRHESSDSASAVVAAKPEPGSDNTPGYHVAA